jgi:rSAM/selenodomain-associated transferase 1
MRSAVVIMAKAPRPGAVKTRLCPPLSPEQAAELYRCFLLDTIAKLRTCRETSLFISYTPRSVRGVFSALAPGVPLLPQRGHDLGARMADCFAQLFARGYTEVLLTGSDLPTLPLCVMQQALDLMATPQVDVVLGPSEDGGYYLIGLHTLHPELFEEMTWSTPQVLAETIRRAHAQRLQMAYLPPWFDVDTPADLLRLQTALAQGSSHLLPHTQRFFRELSSVPSILTRDETVTTSRINRSGPAGAG